MSDGDVILELKDITKNFGSVRAVENISLKVRGGEVLCLLGDNGAGKSTIIKILSGVFAPSAGEMRLDGAAVRFTSPRDALDRGIATVYQDLATVPLMSISRNFFMGREPVRGWWPWRHFDHRFANSVAAAEMAKIGIAIRDPGQAVGTLSGGERQCVAIARAVYFGARVLILDEPTSALGVKQASMVLRYIARARADGLGVVFITHNVNHAFPVGDRFLLLNRGRSMGTFAKSDISLAEVAAMMAGGQELRALEEELAEFARPRQQTAAPGPGA
jgi:simple sugar transport system ATP-binding protein